PMACPKQGEEVVISPLSFMLGHAMLYTVLNQKGSNHTIDGNEECDNKDHQIDVHEMFSLQKFVLRTLILRLCFTKTQKNEDFSDR
ncbi:MAG: hypothetical protein ACOYIG_12510, partial [Acetivibrionales bacterium]